MKTLWVNGWGISGAHTRAALLRWRPLDEHVVIPALPDWEREVAVHLSPSTYLCGYSTGAYLLLGTPALLSRARPGALCAPFFDLKRESRLGGRVSRSELRGVRRALKKSPSMAVLNFQRLVNLPGDAAGLDLPVEGLSWGLDALLGPAAEISSAAPYRLCLGDEDPLLDAPRMKELCPHAQVVHGAGHALDALLPSLEMK